MHALFIHVGLPKCGSSSIQAFLSSRPSFRCKNGDKLFYAALLEDRLLYGKELHESASLRPSKYINSLPWSKRKSEPNSYLDRIEQELLGLLKKGHVILSHEAWSHEFTYWKNITLAKKHGFPIVFIIYIRPPVEYINSAWWQWGAWSGVEFDVWFQQAIHATNYAAIIQPFTAIEWKSEVRVRLLNHELLKDFSDVLNLDDSYSQNFTKVINKGLCNGILRFYQGHRQLRPGPHDSGLDFTLTEVLNIQGLPDWVLDIALIEKIIATTTKSNDALLQFLDLDCHTGFISDARYWDANAYMHKITRAPCKIDPTYSELDEMLLASIEGIKRLDRQRRKLLNFNDAHIWLKLASHIKSKDTSLYVSILSHAAKLDPHNEKIKHLLSVCSEYNQ